MLKKMIIAGALVMSLVVMAAAQGQKAVELTGHIVDKNCSVGAAKKDDPMAAASAHKKGCALSERCVGSGFGVFADGKYVEFDDNGNKLAKSALEASTKANGAKFKVTGKMMDSKLMVESISEVE